MIRTWYFSFCGIVLFYAVFLHTFFGIMSLTVRLTSFNHFRPVQPLASFLIFVASTTTFYAQVSSLHVYISSIVLQRVYHNEFFSTNYISHLVHSSYILYLSNEFYFICRYNFFLILLIVLHKVFIVLSIHLLLNFSSFPFLSFPILRNFIFTIWWSFIYTLYIST